MADLQLKEGSMLLGKSGQGGVTGLRSISSAKYLVQYCETGTFEWIGKTGERD